MMRRACSIGFVMLAGLAGIGARAESRTFDVDRCLGGNCRNGRVRSVTVTPDAFIVMIDPDRCGRGRYCPTRYGAFLLDGEVPARVEGYQLGTPSDQPFTVHVPRAYKTLFVEQIGGAGRFASVELESYERQVDRTGAVDAGGGADDAPAAAIVSAAAVVAGASESVAVVFGVERYRYAPDARFAAHDAAAVRDFLVRRLGIDDGHVLFRVDAQATAGEFARAFAERGWLSRNGASDRHVIVYFAGHSGFDPADGRFRLLPHDADPAIEDGGYALEDLLQRLVRLEARSTTVMLDTALGNATRDGEPLGPAPAELPGLARPAPGTLLVVASDGSRENAVLASKRHGAFTYHLLRGLGGEADADGDGSIDGGELEAYLRAELAAAAGGPDSAQVPLLRGDPAQLVPAP